MYVVCALCYSRHQSPNIVSREISLTPFVAKCSDRAEIQNIASSLIIPSGVAEPRVPCPPCTYKPTYKVGSEVGKYCQNQKYLIFSEHYICIYVGQEWGYNRLNRFLCFVVCRSVCPQCSLHCSQYSQCALQGDVAGPWTNLFAQCKIKTKKSECPRLPGSRGSSVNKLASNLPVMSQYQSFQRDFATFAVSGVGPC